MTRLLKCGGYIPSDKNILHIQHVTWYTMRNTISQEETKMSIQRLHAFEKTSIQARHTIKRLEAVADGQRSTYDEIMLAKKLLLLFDKVREAIPEEFQDVDLKEKE